MHRSVFGADGQQRQRVTDAEQHDATLEPYVLITVRGVLVRGSERKTSWL